MELSTANYNKIRQWLKEISGVELGDNRQTMVCSRLSRRLFQLKLDSVNQYVSLLEKLPRNNEEWAFFVDTLTTHETYFYRESTHFDFLKQIAYQQIKKRPVKILSAACSTGEEAYTLAIEADTYFDNSSDWQVFGTDVSSKSVKTAAKGHYPDMRIKLVPQQHLKQYFLQGINEHEGTSLVKKELRQQVTFFTGNILKKMNYAPFDIIFCRNVLIYFDFDTKKQVISNLASMLNPGGYLFVSQTEQLRGLVDPAWQISPSIMRKPK